MTTNKASPFSSIEDAIEDVKQGKMIVIVDDEDRENEGDLMMRGSTSWRNMGAG